MKNLHMGVGILLQAGKHLRVHGRHPPGRFLQPFPFRVLPDRQEQLPHGRLDALCIHRKSFLSLPRAIGE